MCADIPIAVPVVPWQPPMNDTMRRFPVAIGNSRPTVSSASEPGSPSQAFFSNPPGTGETCFPASSTAGACIPETSPAKALRPGSPTLARRTDRPAHASVAVAGVGERPAGGEVEVAPALGIDEPAPLAALHHQGEERDLSRVGDEQGVGVADLPGAELGHGRASRSGLPGARAPGSPDSCKGVRIREDSPSRAPDSRSRRAPPSASAAPEACPGDGAREAKRRGLPFFRREGRRHANVHKGETACP